MYSDFSGGPHGSREQITQLMAPQGGSMTDGLRLALINGIGLVLTLLAIGLISLVTGWLGWPNVLISFVVATVAVAGAVFFWFRYSEAHGRAARARQRSVRPDVFGAVAALPFAILGLLLVAFGLLGLFFGMISLSTARAGDGLQRLLFAIIFLGLAVTNVIIARAATD